METIAFIGCGAMGAPIAERLIDAGYAVRLFDPRAEAMAPLVARGGVAAKSPQDAASGAEVAFACLPSPEISRAVAFGADGVAGSASLRVYVEMSTIGSKTVGQIAAELARKNIATVDSPVSGGPRGARAGTLSTMAAGEHAAFERVKPMLQALARNVFYVGDKPGLGQVTTLANNMISAAGMLAAYECATFAVKAGVDARTLIDTVNASTGRNATTMDKFPASILTRSFDYGGKVSIMYKDVFLALEEARNLGVPMWLGANVVEMWHMGVTEGRGEDDFTSLIQMFEKWAGVVVGGNESGLAPPSSPAKAGDPVHQDRAGKHRG
jgi:3-hydroxyisobutyrate dehydrogenase-like beta-hydroxyacid dehydrogenase